MCWSVTLFSFMCKLFSVTCDRASEMYYTSKESLTRLPPRAGSGGRHVGGAEAGTGGAAPLLHGSLLRAAGPAHRSRDRRQVRRPSEVRDAGK